MHTAEPDPSEWSQFAWIFFLSVRDIIAQPIVEEFILLLFLPTIVYPPYMQYYIPCTHSLFGHLILIIFVVKSAMSCMQVTVLCSIV